MPNFINPVFRQPNIPQPIFKKIVLKKSDISKQFLLSSDMGRYYKVVFLLNIVSPIRERDPSKPLTPTTVDMKSLGKALVDGLNRIDKKYMKLYNYDTRRAEFRFDYEAWIKDSVSENSSITKLTRFARVFKMKVSIPDMILNDPMRDFFGKFIIRKFKEYMVTKNKENAYFKYLLPDVLRSKMRGKIRTMFDWEYDFTYNTITAVLKTIYIMAIIYAVGQMTKRINSNDVKNTRNQQLFTDRVKHNISKFDYGKFDKYSKRKGFL